MTHDPKQHHRRSIRLRGYDYSGPGSYFITICTDKRKSLFGEIVEGQMRRNHFGEIAPEEWFRSARIRKEIQLDAWVVMPNRVHGIVMITMPSPAGSDPVRAHRDAPSQIRAGAETVGAQGLAPPQMNGNGSTTGAQGNAP